MALQQQQPSSGAPAAAGCRAVGDWLRGFALLHAPTCTVEPWDASLLGTCPCPAAFRPACILGICVGWEGWEGCNRFQPTSTNLNQLQPNVSTHVACWHTACTAAAAAAHPSFPHRDQCSIMPVVTQNCWEVQLAPAKCHDRCCMLVRRFCQTGPASPTFGPGLLLLSAVAITTWQFVAGHMPCGGPRLPAVKPMCTPTAMAPQIHA